MHVRRAKKKQQPRKAGQTAYAVNPACPFIARTIVVKIRKASHFPKTDKSTIVVHIRLFASHHIADVKRHGLTHTCSHGEKPRACSESRCSRSFLSLASSFSNSASWTSSSGSKTCSTALTSGM